MLLLLAWPAAANQAALLGGGEGLSGWLWWVRPQVGSETAVISAARLGEDPVVMRRVRQAPGRVRPWAAAASPDGAALWVAFDGGAVASYRLSEGGVAGPRLSSSSNPALPEGGRARALAVTGNGPWVLWRGDDDAAAQRAQSPAAETRVPMDEEKRRRLLLKLPPKRTPADTETTDDADTSSDETAVNETSEATDEAPDSVATASRSESDSDEALSSKDAAESDAVSEDVKSAPPTTGSRDVLLRLAGTRWEPVALPPDWPDQTSVALLPGTGSNGWPVLLARDGDTLTVWRASPPDTKDRPTQETDQADTDRAGVDQADVDQADVDQAETAAPVWQASAYPSPGRRQWQAVAVGGQVLVVTDATARTETTDEVGSAAATPDASVANDTSITPAASLPAKTVWALRPGGAVRLGAFPASEWAGELPPESAVLGVGQAVVRLVLPDLTRLPADVRDLDDEPAGVLWAMDLNGRMVRDAEPVAVTAREPVGPPASQTVLMAVLMVSTLVMLVFWRRDPAGQRYRLPTDAAAAALDRRAIAGLIDLGVGFAAAWWWFDLTPAAVLERWPGRAEALGWSAMTPALVCIAVTAGHTAVAEALTARSLGKALLGLRVVDRFGRPARGWRGLVRCGLKVLDLVAYLLLVLVVVSPLRQRLGDLVAGTVVVMHRPKRDDDKPADE